MSARRFLLPAATAAVAFAFGVLGYFGGQDMSFYPAVAQGSAKDRDIAAVVVSGDMGLNVGMGGQLARRLAADGIPVIGINSLSYFRYRRNPAEVAKLINMVVRRALAIPGVTRVALIGQSFGADILPLGAASLPPDLRARIAMIGLVVPARTAEFRASPSEIFNWREPAVDILSAARSIDWVPMLCIQGIEEAASLCPALSGANVRRIALPGGHPLHRDVVAVFKLLIEAINTAADKQASPKAKAEPIGGRP